MPYRSVTFAEGEYYHIYNRGSNQQPIFREAENYLFILRLLKEYARALTIGVIAYCLMPSHYHLLVRQDGPEPAGLLPQKLFNSYTKAFNKRFGRTGTLFEGRFKAIQVDRDAYLLHLCRYIHANPVKHAVVAAGDSLDDSAILNTLERWPYCNYPEWIGIRHGALVDRGFVQENFPSARDYQRFVLDYLKGLAGLPEGMETYLLE